MVHKSKSDKSIPVGDFKIGSGNYLILMRHAESEYNAAKKWTGWHDPSLTEKGKKISQGAGKILSMMKLPKPDRLYTSSLKRTIQTAHFVGDGMDNLWCPSIIKFQFNERGLGYLQNTSYDKMDDANLSDDKMPPDEGIRNYPSFLNNLHPDSIPFGLSESMDDFKERVNYAFEEYIVPELISGQNVMLISHSGTVRCICDKLAIQSNTQMGNCDVFIIWFCRPGLDIETVYYGALSQLEKH